MKLIERTARAIIVSSRAVAYASSSDDFAERARAETQHLRPAIAKATAVSGRLGA